MNAFDIAKYNTDGTKKYKYLIRIYYIEFNKIIMEVPTVEKPIFYHIYDIKKLLNAFGELPK